MYVQIDKKVYRSINHSSLAGNDTMVKELSFNDHVKHKDKSDSKASAVRKSDSIAHKSPAVRAMERVGAAEVLLACESVKAVSALGATFSGKLRGKLTSVENDARKTLAS